MVDLMCSLVSWFCFALHLFLPTNCVWLGHWLGLLHVPLPFLALALSSISSASCCRGAQLLGICQSEVWSHMFLESLTLEVVSFWAFLTFSIGKLQKLALSVWAWNFVSFFSIFCSNHSGTLFSSVLAISMAPIRIFACLIILALSAGAADTNSTGIAGNLMENQTKAANLRSAACCPCLDGGCYKECCCCCYP